MIVVGKRRRYLVCVVDAARRLAWAEVCRPQTNGKVERFWRTLNEDLLDGTTFETVGCKTPLQAL